MERWFFSIDWTPESVTAAGTIALAFLTLVLAGGTIFLWLATRRLVKDSENTAQRQLRAYVFVTEVKVTRWPSGQHIAVQFKNAGQTPAYELTISADKVITGYPLNVDLISSNKKPCGALGAGLYSHFTLTGFSLTDDQRQEMSKGKLAVYVFGRIDYKDTFDRAHWTTFRHIGGGDTPFGPEGQLALHPQGNEAN